MSAGIKNYINEIKPKKDSWSIKVRIIRLWKQTYQIGMVLMDEMGDKIQVAVKKVLIPTFDNFLQEDIIVLLSNFGVAEMRDKYPVIQHQYKLNFYRNTSVKAVADFNGPLYGFRFQSLIDIINRKADSRLTVDVIGNVFWCGDMDVSTRDGKEVKRISFDVEDLDGNQVRCTLWNQYAQPFNSFVVNHTSDEHGIVIIQHAKIKYWKGQLTVQNDLFGTRLFVNEDIEEIDEHRKGFILKHDVGPNSQLTSRLSSQTVNSVHTEFAVSTERKYVDELADANKELQCSVLGTIKFVEEEYGWFYNACRKYSKKVVSRKDYIDLDDIDETISKTDDSLWCNKCKSRATSVVPRFKVQVRVQDSTGSVSFVLFDRDMVRVVGVSTNDIHERQTKDGSLDGFPQELRLLIDKMFVFKIDVSAYNILHKWHVYTVIKICDDSKVIADMVGDKDGRRGHQCGDEDEESVKLYDESQSCVNSKEAVSYTGDSLIVLDVDKDSATSPGPKRTVDNTGFDRDVDHSSTKRRLVKVEDDDV